MDIKEKPTSRHLGRKVSRIRELLGVKQETLAEKLGISQQAISKLEQSEQIEDATLERIAVALGVKSEAIKSFSDESLIFHIEHMHDQSSAYNQNYNFQCTFNPVDKWLAAIDENKKLYEELLKSEREKVAMLERMMKGKG
jgi:transcriptional regulator with XRE-family HTH domain